MPRADLTRPGGVLCPHLILLSTTRLYLASMSPDENDAARVNSPPSDSSVSSSSSSSKVTLREAAVVRARFGLEEAKSADGPARQRSKEKVSDGSKNHM